MTTLESRPTMNIRSDDRSVEPRRFTRPQFDEAYDDVVLGNSFFEEPGYYRRYRQRYFNTLRRLVKLPLPRPARILEIGGGQMALLTHRLFGDEAVVADINDTHADAVRQFGIDLVVCDLLYDDLPERDAYDLVVLCEVVEHLTVPPHLVLRKVRQWIRPGAHLFLTTPNLYRLRNAVRLTLGMPLFCLFLYPERGQSVGHPLEYSGEHLRWQIEQAGFDPLYVDRVQLTNHATLWYAKVGRALLSPLLAMRPGWRDNLVAAARKPVDDEGERVEPGSIPPDAARVGLADG
jgi:SAM-dependent methyltransferase